MYHTGELIKFSPFVFKNGNQPKPKYCIVLGQVNDKVMMANLPTSKDHVPSDVMVEHGCVDIPERGVNAFVFNPSDQVTSSFRFPRPTFVYGAIKSPRHSVSPVQPLSMASRWMNMSRSIWTRWVEWLSG